MSALAEALLAAQRQAIGALSKAFVAGSIDDLALVEGLEKIGCTDVEDQTSLRMSLLVVRVHGEAPKMPDPPIDADDERRAQAAVWTQQRRADRARWPHV